MKTHELCILDRHGDTRTTWDPADPKTVAKAKQQFHDLKIAGHALFKLEGEENQSVKLADFDPTVERIIAVAPIAGG